MLTSVKQEMQELTLILFVLQDTTFVSKETMFDAEPAMFYR